MPSCSVLALAETAAGANPSMSESLQRCAEKAAEGMLGFSRVKPALRISSGAGPTYSLEVVAEPWVGDLDRAVIDAAGELGDRLVVVLLGVRA